MGCDSICDPDAWVDYRKIAYFEFNFLKDLKLFRILYSLGLCRKIFVTSVSLIVNESDNKLVGFWGYL